MDRTDALRRMLAGDQPGTPTAAAIPPLTRPSLLLTTAIAFQLVAGVLHLVLTPSHLSEALGTGLFFVTIGAAQTLWAVATLRAPFYWQRESGIILAIMPLALYAVTRNFHNPFTGQTEGVDAIGFITDAAELLAAVALAVSLLMARRGASVGSALGRAALTVLLGTALAGALYGVGFVAADVFPRLGDGAGGHHDAGSHAHALAGNPGLDPVGVSIAANPTWSWLEAIDR